MNAFDQFDATPAAPTQAAPAAVKANAFDQFDAAPHAATATPAVANPFDKFDATPKHTGLAANIVAGEVEGAAGLVNAAADPFGTLVGKPLATLGMGAYNLGARAFGYEPISEKAQHDLLEDNVPTPGAAIVNSTARLLGAPTLDDVVANTPAERYARAGTAGAVGLAAAGPMGGVREVAGTLAAGGLSGAGGQAAADIAPADLKPAAALVGSVVAPGIAYAGARGAQSIARPAVNALMDYAEGAPVRQNSLLRQEPQLNPTASVAPQPAPNALLPEQPRTAAPSPQQGPTAAPNSVGAAGTPPELTVMAPREAAASQARAENYRLNDSAVKGMDKTEYVPGVVPTAAEVMGNADLSTEQKYITQSPGQVERMRAQQSANNDARIEHFDSLAGDPVIVNTLKEARDTQAQQDLAAAWANKQPVSPAPVVERIDQALSGPDGKLSAVRTALTKVRDLLSDSEGKPETDPEVLYGARREVANMLGKAAQQETPTLKDATRQLQAVKDSLDQAIEKGAKGYKQYLQNYSEASKPIDVHELLLEARPDLINGASGHMTFAKVHSLMKRVVAQRQSSGTNPAKSIDDATMEGLWNLHHDLRRLGNIDLGKARGSDTNMMGRMGGALGLGTAHVAANALLPVAGSFMVNEAKNALADRRINKRVNRLMDGTNYQP